MFPQVSIQKLRETLILTVFSLSAARGIGVSKNYHFRAGLFTINMGHLTACSSLAAMSCKELPSSLALVRALFQHYTLLIAL
jgi:hypothetical protein